MQVTVPAGAHGGQAMHVHTPSGLMQVTIPPGLQPGSTFLIAVPAPAAHPMQTAVAQLAAPVALEALPAGQGSQRPP